MTTYDNSPGNGLLPTPTGQEVEHPQAKLSHTGRRVAKNGNTHSLNLADRLTYSPEGSLANLFPWRDEEEERKMTATYGRKCFESLRISSPDGSLRRTCEALLTSREAWYSSKCALIWKVQVTPYKRLLFLLSPSMRHTAVTECGLLHTPAQDDHRDATKCRPGRTPDTEYLRRQIGMLPTPRVSETEGAPVKNVEIKNGKFSRKNARGVRFGVKVKDILAMLPTPRETQGRPRQKEIEAGNPKSRLETEIAMLPTPTQCDHKSRGPNSKQGGVDQTVKMLPTPKNRGWKGGLGTDKERQGHDIDKVVERTGIDLGSKSPMKLAPEFCEWMMGYPKGWTNLSSTRTA